MLKLYRPVGAGYMAQEQESWDKSWASASIEAAARWAEMTHLRPIFDRYFPTTGKILEGGCGIGHYVIYYRRRGYDIEGVDFSALAIDRLKQYDPTLPVRQADVAALPYADHSLACYYSGGVVEHFEEGPEAPLAEGRRVLARAGRLIITVPYVNAIRRVQALAGVRRRQWGGEPVVLLPRVMCQREPSPVGGYAFAEYVFRPREFARHLTAAGFAIERVQPGNLEWGEICHAVFARMKPDGAVPAPAVVAAGKGAAAGQPSSLRQLWRDVVVTEYPRQRWVRPLVRALSAVSGHMVVFVCRPR